MRSLSGTLKNFHGVALGDFRRRIFSRAVDSVEYARNIDGMGRVFLIHFTDRSGVAVIEHEMGHDSALWAFDGIVGE